MPENKIFRYQVYEYKGNSYWTEGFLKIKCPVTGSWLPGVLYSELTGDQKYVREQQDFYEKFKEVK